MLWYKLLFIIVAVVDIIIGCLAMRQNRSGKLICKVMAAACSSTVFYLLSISTTRYFLVSLFSTFYFISVDLIVLFLLQFSSYISRRKVVDRRSKIFSVVGKVLFAADSISLLLNPFFGKAVTFVPETDLFGDLIYKYDQHLLFDLHLLFCYLVIATIIVLLITRMRNSSFVRKRKYAFVLLALAVVVLLNIVYLFVPNGFNTDVSVLFYSAGGLLIYCGNFTFSKKTIRNATRNFVLNSMEWPLIVIDEDNALVDCNEGARMLFPKLEAAHANGFNEFDTAGFIEENHLGDIFGNKTEFTWKTHKDGEEHTFDCRINAMRDSSHKEIGRILIMNDVTYIKDSVTGLDLTPALYRYISNIDFKNDTPIQIIGFNVNTLGTINRALGHDKGNIVMKKTASVIEDIMGPEAYLAKMEDGTIMCVLKKTRTDSAKAKADAVTAILAVTEDMGFHFGVEYGMAEMVNDAADIFDAVQECQDGLKNRKLLSRNSHDSALMNSMTQMLLESDYETNEHVERTKDAAVLIAGRLGLSDKDLGELELLCLLHDIGKIGIPDSILLKKGKLDKDEWEIMKTHADKGYRIAMASRELRPIANYILHHHERWDGEGYPSRLAGEKIPLLSRIITVLDSYDVMTHDRPYHKAMSEEEAKAELRRCSGTQFDPNIVEAYLEVLENKGKIVKLVI